MIKIVYCLTRKNGLSRAEFQDYWRNNHAPLVRAHAAILGIERYVQSHTLDSLFGDAANRARAGVSGYDGVAELWFASLEALERGAGDPEAVEAGRILLEDEARFIDFARSPLFLAQEHEIIAAGTKD